MKDIKRKLSLVMITVLTICVLLNGIPAGAVADKKATKKTAAKKTAIDRKAPADKAAAGKKAASDKKTADAVSKSIKALPSGSNLKLSDETTLNAAAAAFSALTSDQQSWLPAKDKSALTALIAQLTALKKAAADKTATDHAAADAVSQKIKALPSISDYKLRDEAALNEAMSAFSSLTADQQLLLTAADQSALKALGLQSAALKEAAVAKAAADQTAADAASKKAAALPSISNLKLSDEAALKAALAAFNALTADQRLLINSKDQSTLTALTAQLDQLKISAARKAAADKTAAGTVSKTIKALPLISDFKLSDELVLKAALTAFGNLTPDQHLLISAKDESTIKDLAGKLVELKMAAALNAAIDKAAAASASKAIEALPSTSSFVLSDESVLNAALAVFNALTANQQLLVNTKDKSALTALTAQLSKLKTAAVKKAAADKTAAGTVSRMINNLPSISDLSVKDEDALTAAFAAFNGLTADQQALITAKDQSALTALSAQLERLKKAAADKADEDRKVADTTNKMIEALPSISNLKISDETALYAALASLNSLSPDQQLCVSANNQSILTALTAQLSTLKKAAADRAAADAVSKTIEALPSISNLKLSDETALYAALASLNSLSPDQQLFISTNDQSILTALATQLSILKKAAADKAATDQAAAAAVSKTIEALPSISNLKLNDEATLNSALTAFNNLTSDQLLLISAIDKSALTDLADQLTKLKKEAAANNYKVVYSDDFETLPTANGWIPISSFQQNAPQFNWLADKSHSGAKSISLVANQSSGNFKKVVTVESGRTYRFSVYIAFEKVTGGKNDGVFATIAQLDSNGNVIPNTQRGDPYQGSTTWCCINTDNIIINPGTTSLGIYLGINGSGTVWFDDLSLEELSN